MLLSISNLVLKHFLNEHAGTDALKIPLATFGEANAICKLTAVVAITRDDINHAAPRRKEVNDYDALSRYEHLTFSAGLRGEMWQIRTRSLGYGQTDADVALFKKNDFS